jgi:probable addiction module antidote protein
MKTPTTKGRVELEDFDVAEFMDSPESQAFFLSDALATGDRGYILHTLNALARARGMSDLAEATGVNRQALYAALGENGNPTLGTLLAILNGLGLKLQASVRPVETAKQEELA